MWMKSFLKKQRLQEALGGGTKMKKNLITLLFVVFIISVISTILYGLSQPSFKSIYFKDKHCRQKGDIIFVYADGEQKLAKSEEYSDGVINNFKTYTFKEACKRGGYNVK